MWEAIKKNKAIAVFILFLIIGLAIYANSLGNRFFWDDDDVIVNNAYVQNFEVGKMFSHSLISGAGQISNYYRPVLLLSFSLDYFLWGLDPFGFNLLDVLLHILNAWLIFILLYQLIELLRSKNNLFPFADPPRPRGAPPAGGTPPEEGNFWLAFLPALVFLVHPLNTEAVDYVSARADVLYVFFALLSLIFYFNFSQAQEAKKKIINYSAAAGFFILSLLTKETAVVLPVLAVLLELVFLSPKAGWEKIKEAGKKTWPLFAILAVYIALHLTVLNFNNINGALTGCLGDYCSYGVFKRSLVFLLAVLNYFKILFLPIGLHMERAVAEFGSIYSWKIFASSAVILLWAAAAIIFWKKEKIIAFGFGWFFIILFPVSGILVKMNYPTYEHFLYLPMVGFWLAVFSLLSLLLRSRLGGRSNPAESFENGAASSSSPSLGNWSWTPRNDNWAWTRVIFCVIIIAYSIFFGFLTIERNRDWRDPITFYEKNLKYSPQSYIEHNNLGMAYDAAGRFDEAIAQYRQAIAIKDAYPQVHSNLANSLASARQYAEAEKEYQRAIAMDQGFILPYQNLYNLYVYLGEKDKAGEVLKEINK